MDIRDILALDKEARNQVARAKLKAEEIDAQIPEELQALRQKKEQEVAEKTASFEAEQLQIVTRRVAEIEGQMEGFHNRLDEQQKAHKQEWVTHIVKQVTEV